jgi:hypothetical protein
MEKKGLNLITTSGNKTTLKGMKSASCIKQKFFNFQLSDFLLTHLSLMGKSQRHFNERN